MKNKRVLITGITGMVGSHLTDFLFSISAAKDIQIEIDKNRIRPIDSDLQIINTTKFRNHTGWQPAIPIE